MGRLLQLTVVVLVLAAACGRPRAPVTGPGGHSGWPPWKLPPSSYGSQHLFRVAYEGPEGSGGFRLTLRLGTPTSFQLSAVDRLGRLLWSLEVDGDEVLWMDHREETYCRQEAAVHLPVVGDGPFDLGALPRLLLDRLPVNPTQRPATGSSSLEVWDRQGRRWTAELEEGRLRRWTLWGNDGPTWWWRRDGREAVLSQRREERQVRWRQVVAERLDRLEPLSVPGGWRESCSGTVGAGRGLTGIGPGTYHGPSSKQRERVRPGGAS